MKKLLHTLFVWPKKATSYTKYDTMASTLAALTSLFLLIPIAQDMQRTPQERALNKQRLKEIHPLMPYNPIDNSKTRLMLIVAANLTIRYKRRQKRLYQEYIENQNKQKT